ncbi:MAG TPA: hypothetical protein VNL73_01295 [Verrucomicrobiae bacterium]|nr:hypothetical protein [Verrucomicrobiae bacterium]
MLRPRQLARIGTFHMHEAILDVLEEHYEEGHGLGAAEISRRLGVWRIGPPLNDAIVTGYLLELESQKRAERVPQADNRGGWRLTAEEHERRRDDIAG